MDDEPQVEQLENRIDKLESTIEKMIPSRRDALKIGGAALVGGAAMSGTASAGTNQVGTIGSASQPVDLESEDINNADTITTQDIVVNGTATGPFGGGGILLESGDSITVKTVDGDNSDEVFTTLHSGTTKDVLGGTINGRRKIDFRYKFSDGSNITKNLGLGQTTYSESNASVGQNNNNVDYEIGILPPAKDVVLIEVGHDGFGSLLGAEVLLLD